MKFLKWLGISILILIALFFIIPIFLSSSFHVERSASIEKPVEITFQAATDMNQRYKWDPWLEMDPNAEMNVVMKPEIIGSGYSWKGEIIGEGKITIKEFVPNERIKSKIEFISPQSMESDVLWTFNKKENNTDITWAFEGTLSYPVEKWFGLFMDKTLGPQFEKGLKNFKNMVESLPDLKGKTGEIKQFEFKGLMAVSLKEECLEDKLNGKMITMYTKLMNYLKVNNIKISDSPFAIYHQSQIEGNVLLECGLPVAKKLKGEGDIKFINVPACKTIMASHLGHYNTVKSTRTAIIEYIKQNNLETTGSPWESYITDPIKESDQSKWETKVFFPIK